MPLGLYLGVLALTSACMYTGCVPKSLVPAFLVLMVFGEGLNAIGNTVPVVKTYLGGSVICILGAAALFLAAFAQMFSLLFYEGQSSAALWVTALLQTLWSLPFLFPSYYLCKNFPWRSSRDVPTPYK